MEQLSANQPLEAILKASLKASLEASQIWWEDMGIEIPPAPPAPKRKRTPRTNGNTQATPNTTASHSATGRAPLSQHQSKRAQPAPQNAPIPEKPALKEQIAKASALAKAAPTLEALQQVIENFDAGTLSDHARKAVFARGNPQAAIMAIGEAPGKQEDISGQPFVGPAGQLLDKMLAAIGLNEDSVYITNVCNWRAPGNRKPTEDELALCAPFIARHIELASPKIIIIVGGASLQALTGKTRMMKMRGQWQDLESNGATIPAMPLYHPAFLLRKPELKKYAWRDLLAIKDRMGEA